MTLDYINNINTSGEHIVRLYDFNKSQSIQFRQLIQQSILTDQKDLDLTTVDFIEARNCTLTLRIADEDLGIITKNKVNFFCDLTLSGYEQMVRILAPFCEKETRGYQWLYDIDNPTDFLFSPGGTW